MYHHHEPLERPDWTTLHDELNAMLDVALDAGLPRHSHMCPTCSAFWTCDDAACCRAGTCLCADCTPRGGRAFEHSHHCPACTVIWSCDDRDCFLPDRLVCNPCDLDADQRELERFEREIEEWTC